jgi:23S rRNA-intervening sequence protein
MEELPIIQKTYDLIKWYVPIVNRLPRNHRFTLGERIIAELYGLLDGLIHARYSQDKLAQLQALNVRLDLLRYQTRLLLDFQLIATKRYEYISQRLHEIGVELGGWVRYCSGKASPQLS